jgi:hypothetical protein
MGQLHSTCTAPPRAPGGRRRRCSSQAAATAGAGGRRHTRENTIIVSLTFATAAAVQSHSTPAPRPACPSLSMRWTLHLRSSRRHLSGHAAGVFFSNCDGRVGLVGNGWWKNFAKRKNNKRTERFPPKGMFCCVAEKFLCMKTLIRCCVEGQGGLRITRNIRSSLAVCGCVCAWCVPGTLCWGSSSARPPGPGPGTLAADLRTARGRPWRGCWGSR